MDGLSAPGNGGDARGRRALSLVQRSPKNDSTAITTTTNPTM